MRAQRDRFRACLGTSASTCVFPRRTPFSPSPPPGLSALPAAPVPGAPEAPAEEAFRHSNYSSLTPSKHPRMPIASSSSRRHPPRAPGLRSVALSQCRPPPELGRYFGLAGVRLRTRAPVLARTGTRSGGLRKGKCSADLVANTNDVCEHEPWSMVSGGSGLESRRGLESRQPVAGSVEVGLKRRGAGEPMT